jgi:hypothetical protein
VKSQMHCIGLQCKIRPRPRMCTPENVSIGELTIRYVFTKICCKSAPQALKTSLHNHCAPLQNSIPACATPDYAWLTASAHKWHAAVCIHWAFHPQRPGMHAALAVPTLENLPILALFLQLGGQGQQRCGSQLAIAQAQRRQPLHKFVHVCSVSAQAACTQGQHIPGLSFAP